MLHIRGEAFLPGIVHHAAFVESSMSLVNSTLELVKDPFFGAIEGAWIAKGKEKDQIRHTLEAGLVEPVYCIGGLMRKRGVNLNDFDEEKREQALRQIEELITEAYFYRAKLVVLCSGPDVQPDKRSLAKELFADSLDRLCRYAAEQASGDPLWLCVEHFDRTIDQKRLLGPTSETVEIVNELSRDHANLGITLDLSHIKLLGENVREAVRTIGEHLVHAHIANCIIDTQDENLLGDKHPRFGMDGSAVTIEDLMEFLDELFRQGIASRLLPTRLPVISLEIKPVEGEDPFILISNGKRILIEAVHRLNSME